MGAGLPALKISSKDRPELQFKSSEYLLAFSRMDVRMLNKVTFDIYRIKHLS
jgi:hypothetical protein